jgi:hypothetical protein
VNQDRSRGCSYTSNRGGHATFSGSVRLDTSGTRQFVEAVPVRTPDAAMRTSPSHVYDLGRFSVDGDYNRRRGGFPSMATSITGGASTARQCYPKCQQHQVFHNRPLRRQQFFVAAQPTGTSPREDYGRLLLPPLQDLLQAGRKCRCRRVLGRSSKDLNRRSCPDYPAQRGDRPYATIGA